MKSKCNGTVDESELPEIYNDIENKKDWNAKCGCLNTFAIATFLLLLLNLLFIIIPKCFLTTIRTPYFTYVLLITPNLFVIPF